MHFGFSNELTLLHWACCHLVSHKYAYFLQFIEAMGMFLCNKFNHHRWFVFASNFFVTLELHCLVVVVSVDHTSVHLADCCTLRFINMSLLVSISEGGTD